MKKPTTPSLWKHCPSCRQARLAKQLGQTTIRGERLDILQCQEGTCELLWCTPARHLHPVPAAA